MIVAVDTGGTKTLVAVFDTEGKVIAKQKFPTPVDIQDYKAELQRTIDELVSDQPITCLSIALPGTIKEGHMVWAGNLGWHDTNIKALLSDHYDCPIIVENDANLAGLAEARALTTTPNVCLYITVSTGIGTGIITNGKIDPNFSTSEGGQIILEHEGEFARWETFASGKAILAKYGKLASEIDDDTTWRQISRDLAKGFMTLIPTLMPDIIVIGGGVGTHFDKFKEPLIENMEKSFNKKSIPIPPIIEAAHPEEAVVYGCYYHAVDLAIT
jgi:predicted NBD/HSP70 family sugar kinase